MEKQEVLDWTKFIRLHLWLHRKQFDEDDVQDMWLKLLERKDEWELYIKQYKPRRGRRVKTIQHYMADAISNYCKKLNRQSSIVYKEDMDTLPDNICTLEIDLSALSTLQQQILRLYYWEGLHSAQIAKKLSISKDKVGREKRKALARLRTLCISLY